MNILYFTKKELISLIDTKIKAEIIAVHAIAEHGPAVVAIKILDGMLKDKILDIDVWIE